VHRLTQPATPTTTGKVERFHQTLRRPSSMTSPPGLDSVQAAIDVFRQEYNTDRPHQSLHMAFPADRVRPGPPGVVPVYLPASRAVPAEPPLPPAPQLQASPPPVTSCPVTRSSSTGSCRRQATCKVAGNQFWLGPARSGVTVRFWADTDVIHLMIGGGRIKSVRSHLSVTDLAALLRQGGRTAGPPDRRRCRRWSWVRRLRWTGR
jgi:hypothetical protein